MALSVGTRLGPYEILAPLGAGGMGEVYRAQDKRLERMVAIKVLSSNLSQTPDLKQRFEREAKTISSLQHPHICVLHDIGRDATSGTDFLVMEYLEGETLAERLRKGPLPLPEQLKIAIQIADALGAAHRAGVVHRDLKPGNVMLTQAGAKLLDFGLAKPLTAVASSSAAAAPSFTAVRTMSGPSPAMSPLTTQGSIVGTIQYMSPEQIEGKDADARSDIFAFGSMLYEVSTGKRPFEGKSQLKIASAILEDEPASVRALQPRAPAALERLIDTCLKKDPRDRVQCAQDLKLHLSWLSDTPEAPNIEAAAKSAVGSGSKFAVLVAAGIAAVAVAMAAFLWLRAPAPMALETYVLPPDKTSFTLASDDGSGPVVLSPDGTKIAFVGQDEHNENHIYVRALDDKEAKAVTGTQFATYPFWSPDGNSLGFQSGGRLRRVDLTGGPVLDICNVSRFRGGTWGRDAIFFTPDVTSGVFRVAPNAGSQPAQVTALTGDQSTHRWPALMPDGKHFVYLASNHSDPGASGTNGIYFASTDGKENHFVVAAESNAVFARGHLLWEQGGSLLAQQFDPSTGKLRGTTTAIAGSIGYNGSTWRAAFDANANGMLVYQPGLSANSGKLLLYGKDGKSVPLEWDTGAVMDIRLSPDGRKIAVLTRSSHDVWLLDLRDGTRVRFTFSATADGMVWSADSKYLYYANLGTNGRVLRKAVDGSGGETTVVQTSGPVHVSDISLDGKYLLIEQRSDRVPTTTWVVPLSTGKPRLLAQDPVGTHGARISPDNKWIVYSTSETGRNELYLTSLEHGGKQQLTSAGGWTSRWSADGKTLYYSTDEGGVFALPLTISGDGVVPGKPVPLFTTPTQMPTSFYSISFDATPDGQHFVANVSGERADQSRAVLVTNWPARLKK